MRDKTFQRGFRIGRQFIGMVEVCDEPQSVNDGQTIRQFFRDACRFDRGSPGADPDCSDDSGITDARGDLDYAVVIHRQRVAAAQKNVVDFGGAVEPCADGVEIFIGEREVRCAVRPEPFAETETAADETFGGGQQNRTVAVTADQIPDGALLQLRQPVGGAPGVVEFPELGKVEFRNRGGALRQRFAVGVQLDGIPPEQFRHFVVVIRHFNLC